ncbi:MAG TPA: LysR family transcriptional regulator [Hyphomicrobiaceae bacterium]|nr:LysR family transcriptional regulator [Hyphomicrobiaceae bacterium]
MNLRQVRHFIAVAEERNIGRAAKRLRLSQPPLTRQMQQLEAEIGTSLFLRTRRGVQLTAAGEVLLDEARNLLAVTAAARERTLLAAQGRLGRLDVGLFGANVLAVSEMLGRFRQTHPKVDVVVHAMNKDEQVEALRKQRLAVGFNLLGVSLDDIGSEPVKTERLVIALPQRDPLARRPRLGLAELATRPLVIFASGPRPNLVDVVFGLCRDEGFQPTVTHEVVDSIAAVGLVAAGFGFALVPQWAACLKLPGVVYRRLGTDPRVGLHCIYRRGDQSPILAAFLKTMRSGRAQ